jgi:DNA-binding GntR family transcriptional regulator
MSIRIRYFPEGSVALHERTVHEVIQEHQAILDAIRTRESGKVAELVLLHLQNGEKRAMAALAGSSLA